jgi:hypothetical protein
MLQFLLISDGNRKKKMQDLHGDYAEKFQTANENKKIMQRSAKVFTATYQIYMISPCHLPRMVSFSSWKNLHSTQIQSSNQVNSSTIEINSSTMDVH